MVKHIGTFSFFNFLYTLRMRCFSFFLFCVLCMAFSHTENKRSLIHRFIVLPDSKLTIDGQTNVNTFRCAISRYAGNDTLVLHEGGVLRRPIFKQGAVSLAAAGFDCGLALMTNDFNKTIKANQHPNIVINFKSFERVVRPGKKVEVFKALVEISLGGTSRTFEMDCSIEAKSTGIFNLKGERHFTFSDFSLEPPKKMMGLIRIEEQLVVNFNLVLQLDGNS